MEKTSIIEHLKDLRKRLILVSVAFLVAASLSFSYARRIRDVLRTLGGDIELIYITPSEALMTDVKISLLAGFFLALPFILYQVWIFVAPGLYRREKKYLALVVLSSLLLFALGSLFAFTVVLPFTMAFFRGFAGPGLSALFSYDKYISYIATLTTLFGVVFQLPLIMVFLAYAGIITPDGLRRQRKLAVLVTFVVAAVLTPPDVVSQIMMAVPIIGLYELSVILTSIVTKRKRSMAEN